MLEEDYPEASLANWRTHPFNVRGFHNVDRLIATQPIECAPSTVPLPRGRILDLAAVMVDGSSASSGLLQSHTDGFMVLHRGAVVVEQYGPTATASSRHIIFSVSKSVTGTLAGVLADRGELDPDAPVSRYVPEIIGSAYGDATVRNLLDMTVSVRFIEDYLDPLGDVARYRVAMDWNPPGAFPYQGGLHYFLATLPRDDGPHGERFQYVSPNSDLLGWVLENAGGLPMAEMLSRYLWQPMGAESSGFITVDRNGAARTAGGICVTLSDLARFGDMMRQDGKANGRQVIPEAWIKDIMTSGDPEAWQKGDMTNLLPEARYRSKWYIPTDHPGTFCAIGIHGQWIYVDKGAGVTAVKFSSQPLPVDDALDKLTLATFRAIADALR
ncbi:serine hydrolase [Rhizobium sp. TH2]|uniref:serine hydrolase domain-containing protein n=1 Tax=Rhizobium sp. TH2 TaxID=2775403 RepID=UPI0021571AB1|nr:serine hydrolase [Rhizobium sp. TH2]UVC11702.1 serine hydrolase [Rhizobium sp. TH2]